MRDVILELTLILSAVIGALVVASQPARAANQAFGLVSLALCGWLAVLFTAFHAPTAERAEWAIRTTSLVGYSCFVGILILQIVIIKGSWHDAAADIFPSLASIPLVTLLCFSHWFLQRAQLVPGGIPAPVYGPGFGCYAVLACLTLCWLLLNFIVYRKSLTGVAGVELDFMLLGSGVGLFWTLICGMLVPGLLHTSVLVAYDPLATTFLQVTLAYGIATKKILDPAYYLRRFASYTVFALAFFGIYEALQAVLRLIDSSMIWSDRIAFIFGAAVAYPLFRLSTWLGARLLLPLQIPNSNLILERLVASRHDSRNEQDIIDHLAAILLAEFQIESVQVVLRDHGHTIPEAYARLRRLLSSSGRLEKILVRDELGPLSGRSALKRDFPRDAEAIVSLVSPGAPEPLGFLVLGPRLTRKPYNTTVQRILVRLAEPVAFFLDHFGAVAEARTYSEQVRRADRLSSLGIIAANLAHELKNPLSVIFSLAQALRDRYDDPFVRNEFTEVTMKEVKRLDKLLRQLMHLGKPPVSEYEKMDLSPLIRGLEPLLSPQLTGVDVAIRAPGAVPFYGNRDLLEQAIFNVALNAVEATRGQASRRVEIALAAHDGAPVISIDDNGGGIAEADLPLIFDPFFSRKENGTGLGLSIVDQIIREHGGTIEAGLSELGGTRFVIKFDNAR